MLLVMATVSAIMSLVCLANCDYVNSYVLAFLMNKWWWWWWSKSVIVCVEKTTYRWWNSGKSFIDKRAKV